MIAPIHRKTTDENFEHCARTLLPVSVALCRSLEPGQTIDRSAINCIRLAAEATGRPVSGRSRSAQKGHKSVRQPRTDETTPPWRYQQEDEECRSGWLG
jgi:hypothetical protein